MKISAIIRWILAALSFAYCVTQMAKALKISSLASAPYLLFGFAAFITTALLLAPETIGRAAEFFSSLFTRTVFPNDKHRKPPLSYILARLYSRQMRYGEAVAEYRKILFYYPDEESAYQELIAILEHQGEDKLSRKYTSQYQRHFRRAFTPPLPSPNKALN